MEEGGWGRGREVGVKEKVDMSVGRGSEMIWRGWVGHGTVDG